MRVRSVRPKRRVSTLRGALTNSAREMHVTRTRHSRHAVTIRTHLGPRTDGDEVPSPSGVSFTTRDSCPTQGGCRFQSCHASSEFCFDLAPRASTFFVGPQHHRPVLGTGTHVDIPIRHYARLRDPIFLSHFYARNNPSLIDEAATYYKNSKST